MKLSLHFFPEAGDLARSVAQRLGIAARPIALHRFPDGESLVTAAECDGSVVLQRSLDNPNSKLIEVILAAAALRDRGACHITLLAPYLGYMRQDMAFAPGQAVSQMVMGRTLSPWIDAIVSVAPHLHRTASLDNVFSGCSTIAVDAGPAMAAALGPVLGTTPTVLVGPDEESEALVRSVAAFAGCDFTIGRKKRLSDSSVEIELPPESVRSRHVIVVDDVASSGGTLAQCARASLKLGAITVEALVCHALFDKAVAQSLAEAGISRVRSGDAVPHPSTSFTLAGEIADAIAKLDPWP